MPALRLGMPSRSLGCAAFKRRGVFLVIVVIAIALMGGLLTLLARNATRAYQDHQQTRIHCVSRAVTDSAVAYARAHRGEWATTQPAEAVTLDVQELLPLKYTAAVSLEFLHRDDRPMCRVTTRVERLGVGISDEVEIELK